MNPTDEHGNLLDHNGQPIVNEDRWACWWCGRFMSYRKFFIENVMRDCKRVPINSWWHSIYGPVCQPEPDNTNVRKWLNTTRAEVAPFMPDTGSYPVYKESNG